MEIAVAAPPGSQGIAVPLAAALAGEIALLDLATEDRFQVFEFEFLQLFQHLGHSFGVRVDVSLVDRLIAFLAKREAIIDLVIIASICGDLPHPAPAVSALRRHCRRICCEVVSLDEAEQAQEACADGVIAKGNEAGGRVSSQTTFVLLQSLCQRLTISVWAQGGITPLSIASCRVAGACGVIIDTPLALAEESAVEAPIRALIAAMDGTETVCLGEALDARFRVHKLVGREGISQLRTLENKGCDRDVFIAQLRTKLQDGGGGLYPVGQEAALAARLATRHRSVAGILLAYRRHLSDGLRLAAATAPLAEASAFAVAHGIRFPIAQGPMTRVSDVPGFAKAVADGGGLPFLALAMLREPEVDTLLRDTVSLLGDQPWGVGILGFVSPELRAEQLRAVSKVRPRFAILAGGRPDQAAVLEAADIKTYIHVPSARLLDMFLRAGSRRFVFEGRECGGHIGPLSSAVLWDAALDVLLAFQARTGTPETIDVLFAGGVHDATSAAMVGVMAAAGAAASIRFGVLMGTAYLFTRDAVETGAIVAPYQDEAVACRDTVILDSDGGHAIQCARTAYAGQFQALKRDFLQAGMTAGETRAQLDEANLGRMRLASKGLARMPDGASGSRLVEVAPEQQKREGMYMLGQIAALRTELCDLAELHLDVAQGSTDVLRRVFSDMRTESPRRTRAAAVAGELEPIAVIGMACRFPKAPGVAQFWDNTLNRVDAITEVPADRWQSSRFYSERADLPDRVISKWGGFIEAMPFDPVRYGIPPASVASIEPLQLLFLDVVRRALEDSGYDKRPFDRERAAVVVGTGGAPCDLAGSYEVRALMEHHIGQLDDIEPALRDTVLAALKRHLPVLTEDSFSGILPNVMAGRVANRFDLGGPNIAVDAACGSSLAALDAAVKELRQGTSDLAVVGGADGQQNIYGYLLFSKTRALSPRGRCRPFDAGADGIAISDGVAAIVCKRLGDALRDGDRIYSVVRGVAGSSDGRDKSLTAPSIKGQRRALERAYAGLEFTPAAVGLVEAHGTGTIAGDRAELETLRQVFQEAQAVPQGCAIGSVKSMIGHTKNAAGLAGLIKTSLALHHRTLPPTLFEEPSAAIRDRTIPFYLTGQARPWLHSEPSPRRAGVSAFGFGGTNFHAVLEEFPGHAAALPVRPAELLVFRAAGRAELAAQVDDLLHSIGDGSAPRLIDVAATLLRREREAKGDCRLALVAGGLAELPSLLATAAEKLRAEAPMSPAGPILFGESQPDVGTTAFLFPGQGSQHVNMLQQLSLYFPIVRERFEMADRILSEVLPSSLARTVFPPPAYDTAEAEEQGRTLQQTWFAQPALGAADYALYALLDDLGVSPDVVAGHSYGEYVALCVGGTLSFHDLIRLSELRGRVVQETQGRGAVAMLAVNEGADVVSGLLADSPGVAIATINAPRQLTVGGASAAIDAFAARLAALSIRCSRLPMSAGFHIPEAFPAAVLFARAATAVKFRPPCLPVYTGLTAQPYPDDANGIRRILVDALTKPVHFLRQIEAMHAAGVRTFIEVGPGQVLSGLTRQILAGRPARILTPDRPGAVNPLADFLTVIGQLFAAGKQPRLERLFVGVADRNDRFENAKQTLTHSATTWLIDSSRSRPLRPAAGLPGLPRVNDQPPPMAAKPLARAAAPARPAAVMPAGPPAPARLPEDAAAPVPARPTRLVPPPSRMPVPAPAQAPIETRPVEVAASLRVLLDEFRAYQSTAQRERESLLERVLTQIAPAHTEPAESPSRSGAAMPTRSDPLADRQEAPRLAVPAVVPGGMAAASPAGAGSGTYHVLLELVSQRTGYPADLLAAEQDMEADLGIDSIKRTEIFSALRERLGGELSALDAETFFVEAAQLRRLGDVIGWIEGMRRTHAPEPVAGLSATSAAPVAAAPAAPTTAASVVPVAATGEASAPTADLADLSVAGTVLALVSARTGYPVEMLDLQYDLEADLGIDSIKRTEIFGALHEQLASGQPAEPFFVKMAQLRRLKDVIEALQDSRKRPSTGVHPAPVKSAASAPELTAGRSFEAVALELVSVRTGYPIEMLALDLDLEADLGIDSIKRTEIFGALHAELGTAQPIEDFVAKAGPLRSLRQVLAWLGMRIDPPVQGTSEPAERPAISAPAAPGRSTHRPMRHHDDLLLSLVSERTGYPTDMLRLDHDLEADLGIDSIKRAEIFGALYEQLGQTPGTDMTAEAFFLAANPLRTLRQVLALLAEPPLPSVPVPPHPAPATRLHHDPGGQDRGTAAPPGLRRCLVQPELTVIRAPSDAEVMFYRPPDEMPDFQFAGLHDRRWGVLLITEDAGGKARQLAEAMRSADFPPSIALVRHAAGLGVDRSGNYEADLLSPDCVGRLRELIGRQIGPVTDIWHLLPSTPGADSDRLELRSLFLLASVFGCDLRQARGTLGAVTAMGGSFGLRSQPARFSAGQAGLPGLVKSLAQEWPEVMVRCWDVDPAAGVDANLSWPDFGGWHSSVEVGYSSHGRCVLDAVQTPLTRGVPSQVELGPDSVILVTGGARGIGAHVCAALAARYGCRVVMTGRTPPPEAEPAATAQLTAEAELKRALVGMRREAGGGLSLLKVEADYQALLRAREMRASFARLSALDVPYDYHCLDVSDAAALEALVESLYREYGRIDGVIHAAGVVEDGLVLDKSLDSFDRVFDTKMSPALTLARVLRPEHLRFAAFFSSVAARYGCAGGADYAAANEALNKLAWRLDARWPGRVVSIGWGPWAASGMATRYSGKLHEERGFDWLPIGVGCQCFIDELTFGRKGEVEVLIYASAGEGPQMPAAFVTPQSIVSSAKPVPSVA